MPKNNIARFFVNLFIIILIGFGIFFGFFASLGWITRHGESIAVPNVTGQSVEVASQIISNAGLTPVILDSAFYDSLPRLSVISQTPLTGAQVKHGRIVYFTINRAVAPTIEIPDLKGYSLSSASLLLKSFGLKLGTYAYTANPVKDAVVRQEIGDSEIAPGVKVPMGTAINLIIGDGSGSEIMSIPNIVGMQLADAKDYLSSMKCSIGSVTPDIDVQIADSGYIYKQSPSPVATDSTQNISTKMKVGGMIDVWIRKNPAANPQ